MRRPKLPTVEPIPIDPNAHLHYNSVGRLVRALWKRTPGPRSQKKLLGAEVGVFRGHLSQRLLHHLDFLTMLLIDPWRASAPGETYHRTCDPIARLTQEQHDGIYREVLGRTVEFGDRAKVMRMTSLEAAWQLYTERGPGCLDFVFIDGDHSNESVRQDLMVWYPLVRPGGLFSGHDYGRQLWQKYVKRNVDAFCKSAGLEVTPGRGRVWYAWKPWRVT